MSESGDDEAADWLDNDQENEKETMVLNPTSVRERIDSALELLSNLKNREQGISRVEIMNALAKDLTEYYGYIPELCELLMSLFSPAECVEYMDASDRPRPTVIRTNTLKVSRKDLMESLIKRGVAVEEVEWSKVAIKVTDSSVPIGATPEYLAGYYMLQSAASMNPVMALDPQPGERVLDMSAAPGGKTSYIAQLMKNSGTVVANDLKPQRQKATVANLHRMGVKNSIVCCYDGRKIPGVMKGFDRVLLDAPCSGLGVISKDQTVKLQRTVKDVQRNAHVQKELLCAAVDSVDPKSPCGGIIVYSTCSVAVEENEQVVQYILNKRNVVLVDTGLEVGRPGYTRHQERRFHPSLSLTRRFYPHVHNMDGFYVAKFRKIANGVREVQDDSDNEAGGEGYDDEPAEAPSSKNKSRSQPQVAVAAEKKPAIAIERKQSQLKAVEVKHKARDALPIDEIEPAASVPKSAPKGKKEISLAKAPLVDAPTKAAPKQADTAVEMAVEEEEEEDNEEVVLPVCRKRKGIRSLRGQVKVTKRV